MVWLELCIPEPSAGLADSRARDSLGSLFGKKVIEPSLRRVGLTRARGVMESRDPNGDRIDLDWYRCKVQFSDDSSQDYCAERVGHGHAVITLAAAAAGSESGVTLKRTLPVHLLQYRVKDGGLRTFLLPDAPGELDETARITEVDLSAVVEAPPPQVGREERSATPERSGTDMLLVCFTRGTMIETPRGAVPIETLKVGDLVTTRDHGPQPLRWIGSRSFDLIDLMAIPNLRPIRIGAGALAPGLPRADLYLSAQHRVLVRSRIALNMYGTEEVLVAAKKLLELPGVEVDRTCDELEYFHLLFDRHEIVFANGAEAESLFLGPEVMKNMSEEARREIMAVHPRLESGLAETARLCVYGKNATRLAMRHGLQKRPLIEPSRPARAARG